MQKHFDRLAYDTPLTYLLIAVVWFFVGYLVGSV